jgi:hypothetical protein
MVGFNDFVEKHSEGINTIGFWTIVGLSTIIGGVAGGGVLSILTAPLFGFLGSLLYAGIVKAYGKITGQGIFPDTVQGMSSGIDALTDAFGMDNHSYIKDGLWASYKRQMGQIWNCTAESIKGWFRPNKPSLGKQASDAFNGLTESANTQPALTHQHSNLRPEAHKTKRSSKPKLGRDSKANPSTENNSWIHNIFTPGPKR